MYVYLVYLIGQSNYPEWFVKSSSNVIKANMPIIHVLVGSHS
jgi:hypothetical protein